FLEPEELGGFVLRLLERLVERLRHPRILAIDLFADCDDMHDREYPRLPVISAFDGLGILEQAAYHGTMFQIRRGHQRRYECVNFAGFEHLIERACRADM